jgi:head-tail adaptor
MGMSYARWSKLVAEEDAAYDALEAVDPKASDEIIAALIADHAVKQLPSSRLIHLSIRMRSGRARLSASRSTSSATRRLGTILRTMSAAVRLAGRQHCRHLNPQPRARQKMGVRRRPRRIRRVSQGPPQWVWWRVERRAGP